VPTNKICHRASSNTRPRSQNEIIYSRPFYLKSTIHLVKSRSWNLKVSRVPLSFVGVSPRVQSYNIMSLYDHVMKLSVSLSLVSLNCLISSDVSCVHPSIVLMKSIFPFFDLTCKRGSVSQSEGHLGPKVLLWTVAPHQVTNGLHLSAPFVSLR